MTQKTLLILVALAFAAMAAVGGEFAIAPPLPPSLVIPSWRIETVREMSVVYVHSEWVVDRFLHVEVVTDGLQINWINETPWFAVSPEPNAYLPYNFDFKSYCRYVQTGGPQWECVSKTGNGRILYQRFDFSEGNWGRRIWDFDSMVPP